MLISALSLTNLGMSISVIISTSTYSVHEHNQTRLCARLILSLQLNTGGGLASYCTVLVQVKKILNHTSTGVSAGVSARKKFVLEFEVKYSKTVFRNEKYES